jgi:hypothetical protein
MRRRRSSRPHRVHAETIETDVMTPIAKLISIMLAGAVLATSLPALADTAPVTEADKPLADTPVAQSDSVSTSSINTEPTMDQRMADCMAIWDKGTHMTKQQ